MREQVKTLIHEFLHLSYDPHSRLSFYFYSVNEKEYEELEDKIEKETVRIYECQPCLVEHLKELLLETSYREDYRLEMERIYRKGSTLYHG